MPFHNPIPDPKPRGKDSGLVGSIAQAERMVQVAFILPCAGFIGWLAGTWLGKHLHEPWMPMAGIVLGIVAGLIGAIRMAIAASAGADIGPDAAKNGKDDPGSRP
jgi:ATP synthase protein I